MIIQRGKEVRISETLSVLYVTNKGNSLCPKGAMCVWEGEITPVLRVCLKSSCGCSGEFCESVSKTLRGGYTDEWRIPMPGMDLVLSSVQADGEKISFNVSIQ